MSSNTVYNISSNPHVRSPLSTGHVMYDVILALMPAVFFGVRRFGFHALLVIFMSVAAAVTTEFVFNYITERENTLSDGSAVVTGLLLALCLPASVPLYLPYIGSVFAILVVKCLFGGLGKNFMNPALGGRVFLLLSFGGAMTRYTLDGVTSATPLAELATGNTVDIVRMFTGHAGGVLGCSTFALLLGGLYLWVIDAISWHIPVSILVSFSVFISLFGGNGFGLADLCAHLTGGGIVMAAFFMATDPVTSPVTAPGQILYGCLVGILSGVFRLFGASADSVSYAVILSNLAVPLIDECMIPKPFAYRSGADASAERNQPFPAPAWCIVICAVLVSGIALRTVGMLTAGVLADRQLAEHLAAYQELLPDAAEFTLPGAANQVILDMGESVYGTAYGNVVIQEAAAGLDAAGNPAGDVVTVRTLDGRDGPITLAVGFHPDGTLSGILYSELNETPGIGMKVGDAAFTEQFAGIPAKQLSLGNEIDAVSGATISSQAVLNAVNAAIDFHAVQSAS